jgi:hypothetical protein
VKGDLEKHLAKVNGPSYNEMIVSAVAMETCNARHSNNGGNGDNYVGSIIFNQGRAVKTTRAAAAGMAVIPLRGMDTFVANGAKTWNLSEALRAALTKTSQGWQQKTLQKDLHSRQSTRRGMQSTWRGRQSTRQGTCPSWQGTSLKRIEQNNFRLKTFLRVV